MKQAAPRRPHIRDDEASVGDRGIAWKLIQDQNERDVPARHLLPCEALEAGLFDPVVHAALVELSQHRPLTSAEIRLRQLTAPRPWKDLGIDRSTWFRRRRRALKASSLEAAR